MLECPKYSTRPNGEKIYTCHSQRQNKTVLVGILTRFNDSIFTAFNHYATGTSMCVCVCARARSRALVIFTAIFIAEKFVYILNNFHDFLLSSLKTLCQHSAFIEIVLYFRGCLHRVIVKAMDCGIVVSGFVLQSRYYVHFRANIPGNSRNPHILPAIG